MFLTALTQGAVCWAALKMTGLVIVMSGGKRGAVGGVRLMSKGVGRVGPLVGLASEGAGVAVKGGADLAAWGLAGLGSQKRGVRLIVAMTLVVGVQGVAYDECEGIGVGETRR